MKQSELVVGKYYRTPYYNGLKLITKNVTKGHHVFERCTNVTTGDVDLVTLSSRSIVGKSESLIPLPGTPEYAAWYGAIVERENFQARKERSKTKVNELVKFWSDLVPGRAFISTTYNGGLMVNGVDYHDDNDNEANETFEFIDYMIECVRKWISEKVLFEAVQITATPVNEWTDVNEPFMSLIDDED